jgi:transposase-like protein
MNKGKRRHHSAEFKVQVVLEAAPGVFDQSRSAAKQELGKKQQSWRVGGAKPINSSRLSVAQLLPGAKRLGRRREAGSRWVQ